MIKIIKIMIWFNISNKFYKRLDWLMELILSRHLIMMQTRLFKRNREKSRYHWVRSIKADFKGMVHEMLLLAENFFMQIFIIIRDYKELEMEKVIQVHRTFMVQILVGNSLQVAHLSGEKFYLEVSTLLQMIKQRLKRRRKK